MSWIKIKGEGVRNLEAFQMLPAERFSFIWGENGAGKTSLLEAICFLSTGRSFRGKKADSFINTELQQTTLFGEWKNRNSSYKIGLQRNRKNQLINQINGSKHKNLQTNNELFAVKVLTPDIFSSVIGRAEQRRNLLDWPLFHVEHSFRKAKANLNRVLKQRNAALKRARNTQRTSNTEQHINVWNQPLVEAAEVLHKYRKVSAQRLQQKLLCLDGEPGAWLKQQQLVVVYQQGWPKGKELKQILEESIERDIAKGFTHYGPHRFDFTLHTNKQAVSELFSRGELKTLAVASQVCQIQQLIENQQSVIVLVDDLFAELDTEHSTWCLKQLFKLSEVQAFITGISIPEAIKQRYSGKGIGWFHVEHGRITLENLSLNK